MELHLSEHVIEFEIGKYLVENFKNVPIKELGLFELRVHLNKLAETYSGSIVRHAFVNIRSIMRLARKLQFAQDDMAEELKMPQTKQVKRPTMTAEQIATRIRTGFAGFITTSGTQTAPGSSLTTADAKCRNSENFWKARTRKSGVADS